MAIPAFHFYLLPTLQKLGDGQVWTGSRMAEELADHFALSAEDRSEVLPSGARHRYEDRASWALQWLFQAGLVQRPKRGFYEITPEGLSLLQTNPKEITQRFLMDRYPSFRDFATRTSARKDETKAEQPSQLGHVPDETPTERLDAAFEEMQSALVGELLGKLAGLSPAGFEHVVLEVLRAMGYAADDESVKHTGQSGDEGIDGIIYQDPLGMDRVYVQAKNWEGPVSGPDLSKFVGAMDLQGAAKGVFVTRSSFTAQAKTFADRSMKRIVLVDGARLARIMIQYGVGVTKVRTYSVCRVDADFFEPEGE